MMGMYLIGYSQSKLVPYIMDGYNPEQLLNEEFSVPDLTYKPITESKRLLEMKMRVEVNQYLPYEVELIINKGIPNHRIIIVDRMKADTYKWRGKDLSFKGFIPSEKREIYEEMVKEYQERKLLISYYLVVIKGNKVVFLEPIFSLSVVRIDTPIYSNVVNYIMTKSGEDKLIDLAKKAKVKPKTTKK
jgi:hypothetical protein